MIGFNQVTSDWSRERHQFSVPIIERKLTKSLNTLDTQLKSNSNSWVDVDQNYLACQFLEISRENLSIYFYLQYQERLIMETFLL